MKICKYLLSLSIIFLYSCHYFLKEKKEENILARVNDSYLYKEELKNLIPEGTSKEDSVTIAKHFIDRRATQILLRDVAEMNLSIEKQLEFKELIEQYKTDLYTNAYLEILASQRVDTIVSNEVLRTYYNENKQNFKLDESLVKLRFINLAKDNPRVDLIKNKFIHFSKDDKKVLESYAMQFNSFALNDTIWVKISQINQKLPFITAENSKQYLENNKLFTYQDSSNVYLVKVNAILERNEIPPFDYIKPILERIILKKRESELIKKFKKDIIDDAIKNGKYEIYK